MKKMIAAVTNPNWDLSPGIVKLTGVFVIVAAVVYALVTGHLFEPLLGTGGVLVGVGQYLTAVSDLKSLLRDKRKNGE